MEVREEAARSDTERYAGVLSGIVGKDILRRSRKSDVVWARYMVAYVLRTDGYSLHVIGRSLGLSHSLVVYAVKNVEKMLQYPNMYPIEREIWMEFQKSLSSQENT